MIYAGITAFLAMVDLLFKKTVEDQTPEQFPREMPYSKGFITLYRNHNPGFSFGFLKQYPTLVRAIPLAGTSAFAGVLSWLAPRKGYHLHKAGLVLLLGGAISNLYDRFVRGYVVDYFSVQIKTLKNVVFNLGDFFIFAGGFLLLCAEIWDSMKKD